MQVSRLSLGGGPIGGLYGNTLETECVNMIHSALKSGVNYIDTAPWYGNGRSEEVLGKVRGTGVVFFPLFSYLELWLWKSFKEFVERS